MREIAISLCFACEKPMQEDNTLKGKYICINQRCSRVGLLSSISLKLTPKKEKPKIETDEQGHNLQCNSGIGKDCDCYWKGKKDGKNLPPVGRK